MKIATKYTIKSRSLLSSGLTKNPTEWRMDHAKSGQRITSDLIEIVYTLAPNKSEMELKWDAQERHLVD